VVVAPCGFDLERTVTEAAPLADILRSLAPRVLLMDGNAYLNRPGPRIADAVDAMAAWLRGDAAFDPLVRPLDPPGTLVLPSPAKAAQPLDEPGGTAGRAHLRHQ
jgi:hypothetical protein